MDALLARNILNVNKFLIQEDIRSYKICFEDFLGENMQIALDLMYEDLVGDDLEHELDRVAGIDFNSKPWVDTLLHRFDQRLKLFLISVVEHEQFLYEHIVMHAKSLLGVLKFDDSDDTIAINTVIVNDASGGHSKYVVLSDDNGNILPLPPSDSFVDEQETTVDGGEFVIQMHPHHTEDAK